MAESRTRSTCCSQHSLAERAVPIDDTAQTMPRRGRVSNVSKLDPHLQSDRSSLHDCDPSRALRVATNDASDRSSSEFEVALVEQYVVDVEQNPALPSGCPRDRSPELVALGRSHRRHRQDLRRRDLLVLRRVADAREQCCSVARCWSSTASLVPAQHVEQVATSTSNDSTCSCVSVASLEPLDHCGQVRRARLASRDASTDSTSTRSSSRDSSTTFASLAALVGLFIVARRRDRRANARDRRVVLRCSRTIQRDDAIAVDLNRPRPRHPVPLADHATSAACSPVVVQPDHERRSRVCVRWTVTSERATARRDLASQFDAMLEARLVARRAVVRRCVRCFEFDESSLRSLDSTQRSVVEQQQSPASTPLADEAKLDAECACFARCEFGPVEHVASSVPAAASRPLRHAFERAQVRRTQFDDVPAFDALPVVSLRDSADPHERTQTDSSGARAERSLCERGRFVCFEIGSSLVVHLSPSASSAWLRVVGCRPRRARRL